MKGKKIIIWGLGCSGEAAAEFCLKAGADVLLVDRESQARVESLMKAKLAGATFCRQSDLSAEQEVDEIVLSPGIPREIPELAPFLQRKVPVVNEIELAHRRWRRESRGPIVALTGSNGKTTTVHMIDQLLRAHGARSFLGGNVGVPFCEFFNKNDEAELAVLELSSFQLESLFEFKAEVRGILNLSYTHGERYSTLENYARAKLRLGQNANSEELFICGNFQDEVLKAEREELLSQFQSLKIPSGAKLVQELESHFSLKNFRPVGEHNLSNLWVAIKACEFLGHSRVEVVQDFIQNFEGPEHRLSPLIKQKNKWVLNDSKSTNWVSTLSALKTCEHAPAPISLILGGQKRGENDGIRPYLEAVRNRVDHLFLVGESGQSIYQDLCELNPEGLSFSYEPDLKKLFESFHGTFLKGSLVFSPAFPSFDQYQNYEERGEHFKSLVSQYLIN